MQKPDVVICSNLYNRTTSLIDYCKSLRENSKCKYHVLFVSNYDELSDKRANFQTLLKTQDYIRDYTLMEVPNVSISGYNFGVELARLWQVPLLQLNDDSIFCPEWEHILNTNITKVIREGKEVDIDPKSIGLIGPTFVECGSMRHQQWNPDDHSYHQVDFVVGHSSLITVNALNKGFRYDEKICTVFGEYDIFCSQAMQHLELNIIVNHNSCFDFPGSKESHFHEGDSGKFHHKLNPAWQKMRENLKGYQEEHIKKWGYNRWFFE